MNLTNLVLGNKVKIIVTLAVVGVLIFTGIAIDKIAYNKGLNVSKVEIANYQARVQKLAADLTIAQSAVTTEIEYKYLTNVVERERIVYRNREIINTFVPEQYVLSQGWIDAHDDAARAREIDESLASNAFPSSYSDREALATVTYNYGVCQANLDQLTALQQWTREIREVADEVVSNQ